MKNKQRLIDVDALLEYISDIEIVDGNKMYIKGCEHTLHGLVPEIINAQPIVEAVELAKYNELKSNYKRLLENVKIMDSALREYQRKYDE